MPKAKEREVLWKLKCRVYDRHIDNPTIVELMKLAALVEDFLTENNLPALKPSNFSEALIACQSRYNYSNSTLLALMNRMHGIIGKCTVSSQVTRNGKVQRCGLWTGHHTGNFERIW